MRLASVTFAVGLLLVVRSKQQAAAAANNVVNVVMDEAFLNRTVTAAELSAIANGSQPNPKRYDFLRTFADGNNHAIVARQDGTCFVAFRSDLPAGVWTERVWDRIGSFFRGDLDNLEEACSPGGQCCHLRSVVHRSFKKASFRSAMETAVQDCVAQCPDCPVVLTGHSQGGACTLKKYATLVYYCHTPLFFIPFSHETFPLVVAVAHAAGVYLAHWNPVGITFGAPKVFEAGGCDAVDSSQWYRFVNSVQSQYRRSYGSPPGGLIYDMLPLSYDGVPTEPFLFCDHIGHHLILSLNRNVAYIGLDSSNDFKPTYEEAGKMTAVNPDRFKAGYLDRLRFLREEYRTRKAYPVELGFGASNLCTDDAECASLHCHKKCPLCPPRCVA